jgi:hypothetical protein
VTLNADKCVNIIASKTFIARLEFRKKKFLDRMFPRSRRRELLSRISVDSSLEYDYVCEQMKKAVCSEQTGYYSPSKSVQFAAILAFQYCLLCI